MGLYLRLHSVGRLRGNEGKGIPEAGHSLKQGDKQLVSYSGSCPQHFPPTLSQHRTPGRIRHQTVAALHAHFVGGSGERCLLQALQQNRQPIDVEATQLEPAIQKGDTRFHRFEQVYHGTTKARHTHAAPRKWIEGALLRCRLPSLVVLTQLSCCARLGFCCFLYYTASL